MDSNSGAVTKNGWFSIGSYSDLSGTLSLQSPNSVLDIWTNYSPNLNLLEEQDIIGILDSQEKVSLIQCINTNEKSTYNSEVTFKHYKFSPHYIIIGHDHLSRFDKVITEVSFTVNDAYALFKSWNFLKTFNLNSNQLKKLTSLGIFDEIQSIEEDSEIIIYPIYRPPIFSIDTPIGNISVYALISNNYNLKEMSIQQKISIHIKFVNSVSVEEMHGKVNKMLRFLEIISGRPQSLLEVKIAIEDKGKSNDRKELNMPLSLYMNIYYDHNNYMKNPSPYFYDVLIYAFDRPDQFAGLMSNWLERDENEEWQIARYRFSDVWSKQRSYDPDRIVAAANMFDLLPRSIFPEEIKLSRNLTDAIQTSKELFRKLPCSSERDNFLAYLGQIKKLSLKKKIRHRSQLIKNIIQDDLREIDKITDEAVELRHFYVHGDKPNGRRKKLIKFIPFLTHTLEFVFCVSDLIDLNWDFLSWYKKYKKHRYARHPFSVYMYNYPDQSTEFLNYLERISE